ncbi:MAG: polyisoprenyl-teichoic acid--peptidoglycan teichoic acid transferase [Actinomycetota bacterium]
MRTTLKRGIGRTSGVNGNGRAVLPPAVLEPMRRYRQPEPPRRSGARLAARIFGWILLALLVIGSGLAGGVYLYGHETLGAIAPHSKQVKRAQGDLQQVPEASAPATALVIGYDTRAGADRSLGRASLSDTIMLMRADPQQNTLSLLSFPRDLVVPIYCNPTTASTTDRINSAWSRCNARGTLDTVHKLTGVGVNYLVTVDFHGFKLLVNKLHGVYVDVDHRYINTVGGPTGYAKIDLHPGYQKLDGGEALNFVRFRHTDSDLYRVARQQLFVEALKDRLATSLSIFRIPSIIGAMKSNLEVARGGSGGAASFREIESYAGLAYHLKAGHLFRVEIPNLVACGLQGAELCAQPSDVAAAVSSFMHPDVSLPQRANAVALGRKAKAARHAALKPRHITTLVLNGTTIPGLARDTSYKLAVAGYHTVRLPPQILADAPSQRYDSSYVYYDPVQPNAKRAASQLRVALGRRTVVAPLTPELAQYAQRAHDPLTVIVVGRSFGGDLVNPAAHRVPTPVRHRASVTFEPGLTLAQVKGVRARLPFRAMVPRLIASGSALAELEPVRAFRVGGGHHELALTFVTPARNVYWQVIETDWTGAPILRKATGTYRVGRRTFELYTNGGHIHMAVLRAGSASYWVVNTLRDELSNETMLAVAKGLQPLGK